MIWREQKETNMPEIEHPIYLFITCQEINFSNWWQRCAASTRLETQFWLRIFLDILKIDLNLSNWITFELIPAFFRRSIALAIFPMSSSFRLFTPSTQTNSSELFGDSLPSQTDCPPPAIKRASNYRPRDEFSCAVNGVDRFPNHEFLRRTRIEPKNQSSAIISPSGTTRKLCSVRVVWCLEKWR